MGSFDFIQTRSERSRQNRQNRRRIRKSIKSKRFLNRIEASKNLTAHREELDERGILSDDFDFLRAPNPRWSKTRAFVLKRDRYACYCCRLVAKKNHCHHILPRRYQGSSEAASNLVCICATCHRWVDLEIYRQISGTGQDRLCTAEIRAACVRILERRKGMMR